ncbi:DNA alkylation repair protein [Spirillospora sp. NPDC127200]
MSERNGPTEMSAKAFTDELRLHGGPVDVAKNRRLFRTDNDFWGVRMGQVFALAKEYAALAPGEIEALLDSPVHEVRVGAVSIMGHQAVAKRTSEERRRELYELYLRRTDRIDTWDLVDVSAHKVVGGHLIDKPRDVLYSLARSPHWWERRVAMFSTLWFIRRGQVEDTFALAEVLVDDDHDLMHKVVGGMLREAGKVDPGRLAGFLDRHAATMPRVMLRAAVERLGPEQREHYMALKADQDESA